MSSREAGNRVMAHCGEAMRNIIPTSCMERLTSDRRFHLGSRNRSRLCDCIPVHEDEVSLKVASVVNQQALIWVCSEVEHFLATVLLALHLWACVSPTRWSRCVGLRCQDFKLLCSVCVSRLLCSSVLPGLRKMLASGLWKAMSRHKQGVLSRCRPQFPAVDAALLRCTLPVQISSAP